jgi:hypothetical protein
MSFSQSGPRVYKLGRLLVMRIEQQLQLVRITTV